MGNNNTKRYLVRLTPIDAYFFGGEVTFGDNLATQNYRVRSNYLPQQSAVLGLMRYEILRQNDCLFNGKPTEEDKKKANELIGEKGFDPQPQLQSQTSYGIIQRISPLFVENRREKRFYTPLPLDYNINVTFDDTIKALYNGEEKPLPKIETETIEKKEAFKSKDFDNYRFWCSPGVSENGTDNAFEKVRVDEIFIETEQVGIQKHGGDDAFFKQTLIRLDDKYNFAFTVDVDGDCLEECSAIVPWGGNQSRFKIEIEEIKDFDFCTYFKPLSHKNRLLLLGDAFIPDDERDKIDFIWGNCIDNRYIIRDIKDGRSWGKPPKSALFQLQSRGSVIYQKDITTLSALKDKIEKGACKAIGLNILI